MRRMGNRGSQATCSQEQLIVDIKDMAKVL